MGFSPVARTQGAERFADRRRPRSCDAPRSACPSAACTAMRRTRLLLPPPRARVAMSGAPKCATSCLRQRIDRRGAVVFARLDDLHQRRPAERADAEKSAAERRCAPCLRAPPDRCPRTRKRRTPPIRRARPPLEHECIGRIEPDGAQQLHERGPLVSGSSQAGSASRGSSALRSTSILPMRRTSRSPLSSMSRRRPFSAGSRAR